MPNFNLDSMSEQVIYMPQETAEMRKQFTYLQSQTMRNKLVFTNILEGTSKEVENIEIKVRDLMETNLNAAKDVVASNQVRKGPSFW